MVVQGLILKIYFLEVPWEIVFGVIFRLLFISFARKCKKVYNVLKIILVLVVCPRKLTNITRSPIGLRNV